MKASDEIQEIAGELVMVSASAFERLTRLSREVAVLEWAVTRGGISPGVTDDLMRLGSLEGNLRG